MPGLVTIGYVNPPSDFPSDVHNRVHRLVQPKLERGDISWEYAGGWNAVALRFAAMAEADKAFVDGLASRDRYKQEVALFNFFVSGQSSLESTGYAAWFIAAAVTSRPAFPLDPKFANIKRVTEEFKSHFTAESVTAELDSLLASVEYRAWAKTRNILIHRQHPGRTIAMSVGGTPVRGTHDVWAADEAELTDQYTSTHRAWLASRLTDLVVTIEEFCKRNL